jgi:hypothetical protein
MKTESPAPSKSVLARSSDCRSACSARYRSVMSAVGQAQLLDALALHLIASQVPVVEERGVALLDAAFRVLGDDRRRDRVQKRFDVHALFVGFGLDPASLGDVTLDAQDRRLAFEFDRPRPDLERNRGPVFANVLHLERREAAIDDKPHPCREERRRRGCVDVGDGHADQLVAAVAQALADDPVDFEDPAGRGEDQDAVGDAVEDGPEDVAGAATLHEQLIGHAPRRAAGAGRGTVIRRRGSGRELAIGSHLLRRHSSPANAFLGRGRPRPVARIKARREDAPRWLDHANDHPGAERVQA